MAVMQTEEFDPDNGTYFGMPCKPEGAALVLVSAPWDATAPDGASSSYAPDAMIDASMSMDLYDPISPDQWRNGIATAEIDYSLQETSHSLRLDVERIISHDEKGGSIMGLGLTDDYYARKQRRVDEECQAMTENIRSQAAEWFVQGKIVGVVGGDSSVAQGAVSAAVAKIGSVGVLQIDAHARLKGHHDGFEYSYASSMYNIMQKIEGVQRIVQVGVRDFSATEHRTARESEKVEMFEAYRLASMLFEGSTWQQVCDRVIAELPHDIFVCLDMSALNLENAPHSPEAVVGGLSFDHVVYLLNRVAETSHSIVGFCLTGVSPAAEQSADAKAGARMLYRMCGIALRSQANSLSGANKK